MTEVYFAPKGQILAENARSLRTLRAFRRARVARIEHVEPEATDNIFAPLGTRMKGLFEVEPENIFVDAAALVLTPAQRAA
ncbi:hypothetical protein HKCCE3408_11955 [Rhodobacterales bacterium HKCCE3408]|nr:hypothetical protein [Rhodobacterales bacterium HKCCE3408]